MTNAKAMVMCAAVIEVMTGMAGRAASGQMSVTIEPSKDTSLYFSEEGLLSNGQGVSLVSGLTIFAGPRRALMAFDVAGALPAGASVTGARLLVTLTRVTEGALPISAALHRMSADWGEAGSNDPGAGGSGAPAETGDATWRHRFSPDVFWSNDGGDFAETPSATTELAGLGVYSWGGGGDAGLIADVQGWLDVPASNFGWMIKVDESVFGGARRFASREEPLDPGSRPHLEITFSVAANCPADFNGDTFVDPDDLSDFITCFFLDVMTPGACAGSDYNGDGFRDSDDLSDFITAFFVSAC